MLVEYEQNKQKKGRQTKRNTDLSCHFYQDECINPKGLSMFEGSAWMLGFEVKASDVV